MKCPYCNGVLDERVEFKPLTVRWRKILDVIVAAGPEGISRDDLMEKLFQGKSPTTVRTNIYKINKAIKPLKITSFGKILRLKKS